MKDRPGGASTEQGMTFAENHGLQFFEVPALPGPRSLRGVREPAVLKWRQLLSSFSVHVPSTTQSASAGTLGMLGPGDTRAGERAAGHRGRAFPLPGAVLPAEVPPRKGARNRPRHHHQRWHWNAGVLDDSACSDLNANGVHAQVRGTPSPAPRVVLVLLVPADCLQRDYCPATKSASAL